MASQEERDLIKQSIQEDLMENIKSLSAELEEAIKSISAEDLNDTDIDFLQNVDEEIENDIIECREMSQDGKRMLWKYKDFQSEEDLNKWLKVFSDSIVEIQPSVNERLGFYVKIATSYA
jgi:hypothetical protein